jgi:hypothetical protein
MDSMDTVLFGAGDVGASALPLLMPRHPYPRWKSLSLSGSLHASIYQDKTDLLAATTYWEIELSEPMAYLRVDAKYNIPAPSTDNEEVAVTFPVMHRFNMAGLRIRYVIERYSDKTIFWATDWMRIPGDGEGEEEPGPEPEEGYGNLVIVHIYDYVTGEPYIVKRMPDVVDPVGSGVDYTWNSVIMKGLDDNPMLENEKSAQLILAAIRPGRFRYRISAQWPDGDSYTQDFLLLVWPKPGTRN